MRNFLFPLILTVALFFPTTTLLAECGDGYGIVGNLLLQCSTFEQALDVVPCGITDISDPQCGSLADGTECYFDIGNPNAPGYILFEWQKDAATGQVPSPEVCTRVKINVQQQYCGPNSIPFFRQCPDPLASDDDDCWPECELAAPAPEVDLLWNDPCHAYALMPKHWRRNQNKVQATAFFTVGRHYPIGALDREGSDGGPYSATEAFLENQLGQTLLGAVGYSPLWGDPKQGGRLPNDAKIFEEAGLCIDLTGALLASPRWVTHYSGVRQFPILSTRCDSSFFARDVDSLQNAPATRDRVLPRLRRWAAANQHELVCVTKAVADERRAARNRGKASR